MSKLNPARWIAVRVGAQVRERNAYTAEVLETLLANNHLNAEDSAFARVLTLGVTATCGTLDETINRCLRSKNDIQDNVRDCLRVSCYELLFLGKQDHAVVDQGVELVRSVETKAARLANAVLHKMLAQKKEFPYGDVKTDDVALARSFGFPLWLAKHLISWMGREEAAHFMEVSNQPASLFFATNACKVEDEHAFLAEFANKGFLLDSVRLSDAAGRIPGCFHCSDHRAVASEIARAKFKSGELLVSDAAAQAVVQLALPEDAPERFLEVGSGRGTKTILLQSESLRRYGSQINLVALDFHGFKGHLLEKRARDYGVNIEQVIIKDARKLALPGEPEDIGLFDTVFVDAPCSGLGTLRRHPEIRWRISEKNIAALAETSFQILLGVAPHVKAGGRLVYSTCTVAPFENELLIKRFLESDVGQDFKIVPCSINNLSKLFFKTRLSAAGSDAHFAALLQRV